METIQDDYPKDFFSFLFFTETLTPLVPLERLLHPIGSCRAAPDDANMFFVPTKIAHYVGQKRFKTNSINNMRC